MRAARIPTTMGTFTAWFSECGLAGLEFPSKRPERKQPIRDRQPAIPDGTLRQWQRLTASALRGALSGRAPGKLPPLDLSAGTGFQRRVWDALRGIAPGKTRTYAGIAAAIGEPKAARAVGGACGANPIPVFVPCHRVTAANGGLGGFSSGLDWKRRLLAREGVHGPVGK